jgi:hypothetical protein
VVVVVVVVVVAVVVVLVLVLVLHYRPRDKRSDHYAQHAQTRRLLPPCITPLRKGAITSSKCSFHSWGSQVVFFALAACAANVASRSVPGRTAYFCFVSLIQIRGALAAPLLSFFILLRIRALIISSLATALFGFKNLLSPMVAFERFLSHAV